MVLFITLTVHLLPLLYCHLMEGICKYRLDISLTCWLSFCFCLFVCFGDAFYSVNFSFGQPIKVNWAYASSQREDTSSVYLNSVIIIRQ